MKRCDPRETGTPKRKAQHIDVYDSEQVIRWCRMFGTTRFQLSCAVEKVGSDAVAVQRQLQTR